MNEQFTRKDLITATLLSFKITTYDFEEIKGATVTLYKFRPQLGIRVSRIRGLKDELASALGVQSVRIIAPLADGSVGIEVPNRQRPILPLSEILCSPEYMTSDMALPLAIGRTVTNEIFMADLADMPHLLVAGATGQGKSVGLNCMLMSLLHKKTPDEMQLVLIDPKKVELNIYSKLSDTYLAHPVITEADEAETVLANLCELMDERYELVSSAGKRNVKEYNSLSIVEPLPYIVVVIDEYGDLIMQSGKSMERSICRLAQKARAVGIHLIISTQRPSATIVTGNIKANFPTRIAFRTTTGTDSRVILDQVGAEKLTGCGDMIYFSGAETTRVQCAYIGVDDVVKCCDEISGSYEDYKNEKLFPEHSGDERAATSVPLLPGIEKAAMLIKRTSNFNRRKDLVRLFMKYGLPEEKCDAYIRQLVELGFLKECHWEGEMQYWRESPTIFDYQLKKFLEKISRGELG